MGKDTLFNRNRRWVFIHNPRTGGTSMREVLLEHMRQYRYSLHHPLHMMAERHEYKSFGFVRNPWDRLVSLYAILCSKNAMGSLEGESRPHTATFREWLLAPTPSIKLTPENCERYRRKPWLIDIQSRSQSFWLDGCTHIGRFERMHTDFARICGALGIPHRPLPTTNHFERPPDYRDAYEDQKMIDFVARHYRWEIQKFGYKFNDGPRKCT